MIQGYDQPLYLLAFDHRCSFEHDLFHASRPHDVSTRAGIIEAKQLIFEGFMTAVERGAPREAAGVLVDEEFATEVARQARAEDLVLAMPVERSGQAEFDFEFGDEFGSHIEAFDPTFAKVLVRYNPDGDGERNRRQTERLARLGAWLAENQQRFLFELLVPPTPGQLDRLGGEHGLYDRELRPELVVETIAALQKGGVDPDVWKIEGLDTHEACVRVVAQAKCGGRAHVSCIVLGRGADQPRVREWLHVAAGVPGFDGFAVGRTIWERPLHHFLTARNKRDVAVDAIADGYMDAVHAFAGSR